MPLISSSSLKLYFGTRIGSWNKYEDELIFLSTEIWTSSLWKLDFIFCPLQTNRQAN